ncbi:LysM domain-containing protein [Apiospora saccharicola]|uniref:LysM domain-containing protein n=1 Tax=Apiospora saccharicola TaxID=335842 RepID=A0ABR1UF53_9PEZI
MDAHRHCFFSFAQLISWNIDISDKNCRNLEMLTGHQICVSRPGGTTPEGKEEILASAPAATATATDGGSSKYKNPCVGLLTVPGPSSCYATTYPPAPPIDFTMPPRVGEGTTEEETSSATPTWTSYDDIPGVLPPYRYKPSVNPTPTPYRDSMVRGCTRFSRAMRKFVPLSTRSLEPSTRRSRVAAG